MAISLDAYLREGGDGVVPSDIFYIDFTVNSGAGVIPTADLSSYSDCEIYMQQLDRDEPGGCTLILDKSNNQILTNSQNYGNIIRLMLVCYEQEVTILRGVHQNVIGTDVVPISGPLNTSTCIPRATGSKRATGVTNGASTDVRLLDANNLTIKVHYALTDTSWEIRVNE